MLYTYAGNIGVRLQFLSYAAIECGGAGVRRHEAANCRAARHTVSRHSECMTVLKLCPTITMYLVQSLVRTQLLRVTSKLLLIMSAIYVFIQKYHYLSLPSIIGSIVVELGIVPRAEIAKAPSHINLSDLLEWATATVGIRRISLVTQDKNENWLQVPASSSRKSCGRPHS